MKVCKACFAHVRYLKRLRGLLKHETALMAANALVGRHLEYCNSLFRGLSTLDLRKLAEFPVSTGCYCTDGQGLFY